MSNFIEAIFAQLKRADDRVVLREIRGDTFASVTAKELLARVEQARGFVRKFGLVAGDRCALLGANSIRWIAVDLALMAEGIVVVPLYSRQAVGELVAMMRDCQPSLLIVGDAEFGESIARVWRDGPRRVLMDEVLSGPMLGGTTLSGPGHRPVIAKAPNVRDPGDLVTIIYTSGTSGEPKGVCLNVENVTHMLRCTTERLDQLMGSASDPDRVFHYLPFNFAGSWILLLSCLVRESVLTLSTDLNRLSDEIALAAPNYFLNVPTLLERVRRGVLDGIAKQSAPVRWLFARATEGWQREHSERDEGMDATWVAMARRIIFRKIKARFGPHLRALICGSAPLAVETQEFFMMLGIPVLQAYGLTETTAISTMDDPREEIEPGFVGPAITGIDMKLGENDEILVRGPHIFPGYWDKPEETVRVLRDGWFHTGDQGEFNARGNWQIIGRLKNLIVLNSGHNVAPEPIEEKIAPRLAGAHQIVVVGNGRSYLCALVTGDIAAANVQSAIDMVNADLPHYRQIRNFMVLRNPFLADDGLITANGKLRRDAIDKRFAKQIDAMYGGKQA